MNLFVILIAAPVFMILAFAIIAIMQKKKAGSEEHQMDISEADDDTYQLHIFYRLLQQQANDIRVIKVCILFFVILTALFLVAAAISFMIMSV